MTFRKSTALEIAHQALLDLESAKLQLCQLESLIFAVTKLQEHPAHASNLIDLAWYLATESANGISANYDSVSDALDQLATHNPCSKSVARDSEVRP